MHYELPSSEDRPIWDIWLSMMQLPAMAVAEECGIFVELGKSPATPRVLATRLGLAEPVVTVVLAMLAAMKLVEPRPDAYALSDVARTYLLPDSPFFWGPLLRALGTVPHHHTALRAVLKGEPAPPWPRPSAPAPARTPAAMPSQQWEKGDVPSPVAEAVARVMQAHSLPAAIAMAAGSHLDGISKLLDVGGGSGCFAIASAQRHPSLRATVLELPAAAAVARRYIAAAAVAERVDALGGDMFREPWPTGYDGVLLSNVMHDWPLSANEELARRAFAALPSGGRVLLHEMLAEPAENVDKTIASFSILMLLTTKGRQYSLAELSGCLEAAGFRSVVAEPSYGYYSVIRATKP